MTTLPPSNDPIDTGLAAENFMRYLRTSGFLVENINPGEWEHLIRKLDYAMIAQVRKDREKRESK